MLVALEWKRDKILRKKVLVCRVEVSIVLWRAVIYFWFSLWGSDYIKPKPQWSWVMFNSRVRSAVSGLHPPHPAPAQTLSLAGRKAPRKKLSLLCWLNVFSFQGMKAIKSYRWIFIFKHHNLRLQSDTSAPNRQSDSLKRNFNRRMFAFDDETPSVLHRTGC